MAAIEMVKWQRGYSCGSYTHIYTEMSRAARGRVVDRTLDASLRYSGAMDIWMAVWCCGMLWYGVVMQCVVAMAVWCCGDTVWCGMRRTDTIR